MNHESRCESVEVQTSSDESISDVPPMQSEPAADDDFLTQYLLRRTDKGRSGGIRTPPGWQLASSLPRQADPEEKHERASLVREVGFDRPEARKLPSGEKADGVPELRNQGRGLRDSSSKPELRRTQSRIWSKWQPEDLKEPRGSNDASEREESQGDQPNASRLYYDLSDEDSSLSGMAEDYCYGPSDDTFSYSSESDSWPGSESSSDLGFSSGESSDYSGDAEEPATSWSGRVYYNW